MVTVVHAGTFGGPQPGSCSDSGGGDCGSGRGSGGGGSIFAITDICTHINVTEGFQGH